jgi:hypothetical protein
MPQGVYPLVFLPVKVPIDTYVSLHLPTPPLFGLHDQSVLQLTQTRHR